MSARFTFPFVNNKSLSVDTIENENIVFLKIMR